MPTDYRDVNWTRTRLVERPYKVQVLNRVGSYLLPSRQTVYHWSKSSVELKVIFFTASDDVCMQLRLHFCRSSPGRNEYLKCWSKVIGAQCQVFNIAISRPSSLLCRSGRSRVRFFLGRPWWWLNLETLPDRLHNALKDRVTNVDGIVTQTISRERLTL